MQRAPQLAPRANESHPLPYRNVSAHIRAIHLDGKHGRPWKTPVEHVFPVSGLIPDSRVPAGPVYPSEKRFRSTLACSGKKRD